MNLLKKSMCIISIALFILPLTISNYSMATDNGSLLDSNSANSSSNNSSSNISYIGPDLYDASSTVSGSNIVGFTTSNMPSTYSGATLLMEQSTGEILYGKNIYEKMYPASTTKIMTAILTIENCKLTDTAIASHNAVFSVPSGYSHANIQEGEELTIEELLNVLLIPSANDAAYVLAEHIAGSVDAFSDMMNAKAKELGCLNTHFVNPNGIHNENHYSTAYDMALIGKYAMKSIVFRQIVSKTSCSLPATNKYAKTDRLFNTTNELIKPNSSSSPTNYYYQYATGAKTGYTDAAANCIVATATKNDTSLLVVILHGERTADGLSQRALDCKTLFEYGFNNFSFSTIAKKGDVCKTIEIADATSATKNLNLLYDEDITAYLPNNYNLYDLTPQKTISDEIFAPIASDTILGTVTYSVGNLTFTSNITAQNDVYKSDTTKTIMEILLIVIILILISFIFKLKTRTASKKPSSKKPKKASKQKASHTSRTSTQQKQRKKTTNTSKKSINISDDYSDNYYIRDFYPKYK